MILTRRNSRRSIGRVICFSLIFAGLLLVQPKTGQGQSFSVNNPEVREPVPQYPLRLKSPTVPPVDAGNKAAEPLRLPAGNSFNPEPRSVTQPRPDTHLERRSPPRPSTSDPAAQPHGQTAQQAPSSRPHTSRGPAKSTHQPAPNPPSACRCLGKPNRQPNYSVHWPRPFSAKVDQHFPRLFAQRNSPCQQKRIVDVFDPLANLKLSRYQRKDNGYEGRAADTLGCLGESKYGLHLAQPNRSIR